MPRAGHGEPLNSGAGAESGFVAMALQGWGQLCALASCQRGAHLPLPLLRRPWSGQSRSGVEEVSGCPFPSLPPELLPSQRADWSGRKAGWSPSALCFWSAPLGLGVGCLRASFPHQNLRWGSDSRALAGAAPACPPAAELPAWTAPGLPSGAVLRRGLPSSHRGALSCIWAPLPARPLLSV